MFGWSSGASLCLYAAAAGLELTRLALFEIPLSPKPVEGNDEASRLRELILADDRGVLSPPEGGRDDAVEGDEAGALDPGRLAVEGDEGAEQDRDRDGHNEQR